MTVSQRSGADIIDYPPQGSATFFQRPSKGWPLPKLKQARLWGTQSPLQTLVTTSTLCRNATPSTPGPPEPNRPTAYLGWGLPSTSYFPLLPRPLWGVRIFFNNYFLDCFIEIQFTYHTIHPFEGFNSVFSSILTGLQSHQHNLILDHFWIPPKEIPSPLAVTPHSSLPPSPWKL